MMFVRPLNKRERQELKRLVRREVVRVSERIRMILLSSNGYSVQQIADIFEYDPASIRAWIERFEAEGVKGLHDRPRSGRPPKVGVVAQQQIRQTVANPTLSAWLCLWVLDCSCIVCPSGCFARIESEHCYCETSALETWLSLA